MSGNQAASAALVDQTRTGPIVAVREASFAYDPQRPVLTGLSFAVAPGEFVGVVTTFLGAPVFVYLLRRGRRSL